MEQSTENRSSSQVTQNRLRKYPKKAEYKPSIIKHSNILDFIRSFKPLNVSTNLLNVSTNKCKRRNTNYSQKIIKNMKEKFDSLPPGYLKKRRIEKLNSHGREQRKIYRNLLDIFREDQENCPPSPQDINTYTTIQENGMCFPQTTSIDYSYQSTQIIVTPNVTENTIDSLLEEELYYQGEYINNTMDELYSIAKIPNGEANNWNFYTNQWPCDEAYQYLNTTQVCTFDYSSTPSLFYSDTSVYLPTIPHCRSDM